MSWQMIVGRLVALIGAIMIGWGISGVVGIVEQENGLELAILGAILFLGGLFFSLLGSSHKEPS